MKILIPKSYAGILANIRLIKNQSISTQVIYRPRRKGNQALINLIKQTAFPLSKTPFQKNDFNYSDQDDTQDNLYNQILAWMDLDHLVLFIKLAYATKLNQLYNHHILRHGIYLIDYENIWLTRAKNHLDVAVKDPATNKYACLISMNNEA